jgi:hypothetical protein
MTWGVFAFDEPAFAGFFFGCPVNDGRTDRVRGSAVERWRKLCANSSQTVAFPKVIRNYNA